MAKAAPLLVILSLFLQLAGCDSSGNQKRATPVEPGAANDTYGLCAAIEGDGLAKQCAFNSRDNVVDITIESFDDEVARNICSDIVNKTAHLTADLPGQWQLQVFSPYRSDKPITSCRLH
jgi:hypothetical protein